MADPNRASNLLPPTHVAATTAKTPTNPRNRLLHRSLLITGLALIITCGGYWWLHRAPVLTYRTDAVTRGTVQRTVIASGTVNPETTVQVGTYISGVIQELRCDFNTQVKAGQLCAKIDPRPYQSIVDQETAALDTARAQLAKDRAALAFARIIYDRDVDLLKRRIVSQETVDTASNARAQAIAQVALDESTIAQRIATLHAANVNLDYTNIISPVDGTVVSRNVTQGQTVAASFQTPTLFLIATDLTQMQVDTNISESDIGSIAVGNKVLFTVEAYPEKNFVGTVEQVRQAPQSVQNVITYDAVVHVPNPQLLLKPGMTAAVRVVTAERKDVLRVPNLALRFTPTTAQDNAAAKVSDSVRRDAPSDNAVWKLVDSRPDRVPVEVGLSDETFTEVTDGALAVGEQIIVGISSTSTAKNHADAWSASPVPRIPSR
jgi:HlyD family secretion protein